MNRIEECLFESLNFQMEDPEMTIIKTAAFDHAINQGFRTQPAEQNEPLEKPDFVEEEVQEARLNKQPRNWYKATKHPVRKTIIP